MSAPVRDRLVSSAIVLLAEHGVAATGVAELLVHSSVARRSAYVHFPGGKAEILTEATHTAGEAIKTVIANVARDNDDPPTMITAFARFWAAVLESSDYTMGCPIVAATLGRSEMDGPADAAAAVFADWTTVLRDRLVSDGVDSELAQSLAVTVVAGVEGAVVMCLAARSAEPLERTSAQLAELVRMQTSDRQVGSTSTLRPIT